MSKTYSSSVQPVATQTAHSSGDVDDVLGYMTGSLHGSAGAQFYVRHRPPQPDKTADNDRLASEKRNLCAIAEENDTPTPSNSSFAREALRLLVIADKIISEFPIEQREAAQRLFHVVRHATLNESTAIMRKRGADKANRGEKQLRDIHKAHLASMKWHTGDERLFLKIDELIEQHNEKGRKLSARSALKKIKYSHQQGTPEKRWPSAARKDIDATLKRYKRHRNNLDTYQTSK